MVATVLEPEKKSEPKWGDLAYHRFFSALLHEVAAPIVLRDAETYEARAFDRVVNLHAAVVLGAEPDASAFEQARVGCRSAVPPVNRPDLVSLAFALLSATSTSPESLIFYLSHLAASESGHSPFSIPWSVKRDETRQKYRHRGMVDFGLVL